MFVGHSRPPQSVSLSVGTKICLEEAKPTKSSRIRAHRIARGLGKNDVVTLSLLPFRRSYLQKQRCHRRFILITATARLPPVASHRRLVANRAGRPPLCGMKKESLRFERDESADKHHQNSRILGKSFALAEC